MWNLITENEWKDLIDCITKIYGNINNRGETIIYRRPLSDVTVTLRKSTYLLGSRDGYKLVCGIRIKNNS